MKLKTIKQSQKVRVILNGILVIGTLKQVLSIVQDYALDNMFLQLDDLRTKDDKTTKGIGTNFQAGNKVTQVQIDILD